MITGREKEIEEKANEVRKKLDGSLIYGELVNMNNLDHLLVGAFLCGFSECKRLEDDMNNIFMRSVYRNNK
jgi:hypothetical protein